jgi:hypothetical protein
MNAFALSTSFFSRSYHSNLCLHFTSQKFQTISFEYVSIYRISAIMASSGRTTAATGGPGTESTPANNVGETRRVRLLPSVLSPFSLLYDGAILIVLAHRALTQAASSPAS